MGSSKKYYWLKLKNTFFSQPRIKKLRRIAGGDTYTIIYLKMQLLSLADEGKLYFQGIEDDFAEEIALTIDEDADNVGVTINFLISQGLMEQTSENEYLMTEAATLIGSETESAERVREHRLRQKQQKALHCNASVTACNAPVTTCNTEQETDIDIEIETDTEQEQDTEQECAADMPADAKEIFYQCFGRSPRAGFAEAVAKGQYDNNHVRLAIQECSNKQVKKPEGYILTVLRRWQTEGLPKKYAAQSRSSRSEAETADWESEWMAEFQAIKEETEHAEQSDPDGPSDQRPGA